MKQPFFFRQIPRVWVVESEGILLRSAWMSAVSQSVFFTSAFLPVYIGGSGFLRMCLSENISYFNELSQDSFKSWHIKLIVAVLLSRKRNIPVLCTLCCLIVMLMLLNVVMLKAEIWWWLLEAGEWDGEESRTRAELQVAGFSWIEAGGSAQPYY